MNVKDLKIGDRVKYKKEEDICGTSQSIMHEYEGTILEIHKEYNGFFQITKTNYYNNQISVKFRDIISKLEPLPTQYKEVPIEKEKSHPKLEDLTKEQFYSLKNSGLLYEFYPESDGIYKEKPKLESYYLYHCPDCGKDWALTGIKGVITSRYCENCSCKWVENPTPKSFKFNIWPTSVSGNYKFYKMIYTMNGYDENREEFENLPCPEWIELGKTYTVEIKEK